MGILVDKLAMILGRLQTAQKRLVARNDTENVLMLQAEVIEPLASLVVDVDTPDTDDEEKLVVGGRKRSRRAVDPNRLTWSCCHAARRTRTSSGKAVWVASCRWSKSGQTGMTTRRVADGGKPQPKRMRVDGRSVKTCS